MNYDTSKIDEWTLEMCRDYLAERAGWKYANMGTIYPHYWTCEKEDRRSPIVGHHSETKHGKHPIPATLDCAATLPEGWSLGSVHAYPNHWAARAEYFGKPDEAPSLTKEATGTSELLARFRLRCKVESLTVRAEIN